MSRIVLSSLSLRFSLRFSLPFVAATVASFALGAAGCGSANPPVASASNAALVAPLPPPVACRDSADSGDAARAHQNLLYPYNLPQYRDDLAAALEKRGDSPAPNASSR